MGKAASTHLKRILILQKKAVRIICDEGSLAHTDLLFRRTRIIRFEELYNYFTLLFIYKIRNNLHPISFRRQINLRFTDERPHLDVHTRSTTNEIVPLPQFRTSLRQNTIFYQLFKLYNEFFIPLQFNVIHSFDKLKKKH